jgi:hypothetical protein
MSGLGNYRCPLRYSRRRETGANRGQEPLRRYTRNLAASLRDRQHSVKTVPDWEKLHAPRAAPSCHSLPSR